jgi:hypothetical protein
MHFFGSSQRLPNQPIYMRHRQPNAKQVPTHQPKKTGQSVAGKKINIQEESLRSKAESHISNLPRL